MGRKKRRNNQVTKPWCFYCDKQFDHEPILLKHQQDMHFRCMICRKRSGGVKGLVKHYKEVHKEVLKTVPHALEDRSDVTKFNVHGSSGIPINAVRGQKYVEDSASNANQANNSGQQVAYAGAYSNNYLAQNAYGAYPGYSSYGSQQTAYGGPQTAYSAYGAQQSGYAAQTGGYAPHQGVYGTIQGMYGAHPGYGGYAAQSYGYGAYGGAQATAQYRQPQAQYHPQQQMQQQRLPPGMPPQINIARNPSVPKPPEIYTVQQINDTKISSHSTFCICSSFEFESTRVDYEGFYTLFTGYCWSYFWTFFHQKRPVLDLAMCGVFNTHFEKTTAELCIFITSM